MPSLSPETQQRIERILQENLKGAEVIASSGRVFEDGEVRIEELVFRMSTGAAWAVNMSYPEERLVLSRYAGPGGWVEITADDLVEEDL